MDYVFISFIFFLSVLLVLYRRRRSSGTSGGFRHYPLVGTLPDFLANRHRFLEWSTAVLSSTPTNTSVFRRPGKVHGVLTASPANVEYILKTNFPNYPKGERFRSFLEDFLGRGIFNSDDDIWRHQRKTSSYEFNNRSLRNFVLDCVRSEILTRLLPLLMDSVHSGRILDLQDVLERFAFDNVCKLVFNVDPLCLSINGSGQPEFMRAFEEATILSSGRFMTALPITWKIQRFFDVGSESRHRRSIQTVHRFADDIIKSRLQEKKEGLDLQGDLLSRFIATDENSPEFLRDIMISFILAGRDTTSSALTWFFWLLSSHPEVTRKIRFEVDRIRILSGKRPGESFQYDEIKEMNYLHAALSEAMRLYPPVPVDTKNCRNDDVLPDGTELKKDWFVTYHVFAMGRMQGIWGSDCEEYRPERWMVDPDPSGSGSESGLCKTESPFKYPVFQAGPRVCLGKEMAYIQMKYIAASVIEGFDVLVEKKEKPEYVLALTLRMKGGLPVKMKLRDVFIEGKDKLN
ncbi:hypothetical protein V2J09_014414 [Rumex salicifolius]